MANASGSNNGVFTPGDLVISISGDGDGSGTYADNQASPIVLEQINPVTGAIVPITGVTNGTQLANGALVLPQQSSTGPNGAAESAVSGEYGSSSEGLLQLSADGQSLVIGGYGVSAAAYNAGEANGNNTYGNAALAQSTSVPGGTYAPVPRVAVDISADGVVDSSTALLNVFNTNNIRSVATVNGSTFYVSGQGVKGDTTQGVFYAQDGATSATGIDTSTDTREAEIYNKSLYVSRDSKQSTNPNIGSYGTEPTSAAAATPLPGLGGEIPLTAAQENGVNNAQVGKGVYLSPESYFFADATTLYVADGGQPKNGTKGAAGLGDGGLQKWTLNNGTWTLDYTLSQGLNLVSNTASSGTTGLIGLTGAVSGNTVQLYATNETLTDTGQTYLYSIADQLNATTTPANESFTPLVAAAGDTDIRGVAFAPQAAATSSPPVKPTIANTHASSETGEQTVSPFSGVTIRDGNAGADDSLAITLTGAGGTLSGQNGDLAQTGTDSYALAMTDPGTLSRELDALSFTPTNGTSGATVSTTFQLTAASNAGTSATDSGTTVTDTNTTSAPTSTGTPPSPSSPPSSSPPTSSSPPPTSSTAPAPSSPAPSPSPTTSPAPAPGPTMTTTQNPDGSTTTTTKDPDGSSTSTTQEPNGTTVTAMQAPNGQTTTTTQQPDGTTTTAVQNPDGTTTTTTSGGPGFDGKPYASTTDTYAADGTQLTEQRARNDGTTALIVDAPGQTLDVSGATFVYDQHQAGTTFVFQPGAALGVVHGFTAGGAGHDLIDLSGADFGDRVADVLRNTIQTAGGTVTFDPVTNGIVRLPGVSAAELKPKDFTFHG